MNRLTNSYSVNDWKMNCDFTNAYYSFLISMKIAYNDDLNIHPVR